MGEVIPFKRLASPRHCDPVAKPAGRVNGALSPDLRKVLEALSFLEGGLKASGMALGKSKRRLATARRFISDCVAACDSRSIVEMEVARDSLVARRARP